MFPKVWISWKLYRIHMGNEHVEFSPFRGLEGDHDQWNAGEWQEKPSTESTLDTEVAYTKGNSDARFSFFAFSI